MPIYFLNDVYVTGMVRMACNFSLEHDDRFTRNDVDWHRLKRDQIHVHRVRSWKKPFYHKIYSEQQGDLGDCSPGKLCLKHKKELFFCEEGGNCVRVDAENNFKFGWLKDMLK